MTIMMMVEGLRLLDEKMAGSENTKIVKKTTTKNEKLILVNKIIFVLF